MCVWLNKSFRVLTAYFFLPTDSAALLVASSIHPTKDRVFYEAVNLFLSLST